MSSPSAKPSATSKPDEPVSSSGSSAFGIGFMIFYVLIMLVSMAGAAKLSYDKFHSVGWAILDFFFSTYYYIYYAFFVSKPSSTPGVHPLAGGKSWRP